MPAQPSRNGHRNTLAPDLHALYITPLGPARPVKPPAGPEGVGWACESLTADGYTARPGPSVDLAPATALDSPAAETSSMNASAHALHGASAPRPATAPPTRDTLPIQPTPRQTGVSYIVVTGQTVTAITRWWNRGDARRCLLCPNGQCAAFDDVCTVQVGRKLAIEEAVFYACQGSRFRAGTPGVGIGAGVGELAGAGFGRRGPDDVLRVYSGAEAFNEVAGN